MPVKATLKFIYKIMPNLTLKILQLSLIYWSSKIFTAYEFHGTNKMTKDIVHKKKILEMDEKSHKSHDGRHIKKKKSFVTNFFH